jgi:hypothetical protein
MALSQYNYYCQVYFALQQCVSIMRVLNKDIKRQINHNDAHTQHLMIMSAGFLRTSTKIRKSKKGYWNSCDLFMVIFFCRRAHQHTTHTPPPPRQPTTPVMCQL